MDNDAASTVAIGATYLRIFAFSTLIILSFQVQVNSTIGPFDRSKIKGAPSAMFPYVQLTAELAGRYTFMPSTGKLSFSLCLSLVDFPFSRSRWARAVPAAHSIVVVASNRIVVVVYLRDTV